MKIFNDNKPAFNNDHFNFVEYHVTGRYYNSNKRFKMVYKNFMQTNCINLWNGTIYGVKADGKRVVLKKVYN